MSRGVIIIQLSGYNFEQPYILRTTSFNNVPAVYVVYTVIGSSTVWLDVGETDKLGERIPNHERRECWSRNSQGKEIYIAVMQVHDEFSRRNIESDLRNRLLPMCGEK